MRNNILLVENISHSFREKNGQRAQALRDISFLVKRGEFLSIIGPSGCGKSTLLKIIAGLIPSTRGHIENNSSSIAMVFQNFAVFPWLSVIENVEFGLKMSGMAKKKRHAIALEKIRDAGLSGFENKHPHELSGGMRQRVGIARALAVSPDLLLMDEPFSSLDELTAEKLRVDLMTLWDKYKMTVIMVTHLVEEAVELSDKIVILSSRPGALKKIISVNLNRPRVKRSEEYFKLVDLVTAEIDK